MPSTAQTVLQTMRPPFLVLAPTSILVGTAAAASSATEINLIHVALITIAAISANISVNMLNEYSDFKTELDLNTARTPFSGGSGALPSNPDALRAVVTGGVIALLITLAIGIFFLTTGGWTLAFIGLLGAAIILTYTDWLNRYPLACLFAPGISFGPLMVMGTELILSGQVSMQGAVTGLVPLFLVSNLLLLNQFPDIDADRQAGRNHLLIQYGIDTGKQVYRIFGLAALLTTLASLYLFATPIWLLTALPSTLLIGMIFRTLNGFQGNIERLVPAMGQNVVLTLITPTLLGLALLLS